jgi:hypothetical protein
MRRRRPPDEQVARTAGLLDVLGSLADRGAGRVLTSGLGESIDRAARRLGRPRFTGEPGLSGLGSRTSGPEGGCPLVAELFKMGGIGAFGLTGDPEEARLTSLPRARLGTGTAPEIGEQCVSKAAVAHTLRHLQNPVRSCYERQLRLAPELRGELRVRFVIDGTGTVIDAHVVDNTLGNRLIEGCVLDVLERRTFPPCEGGGVAQVSYRWRFKPAAR